MEQFKNASNLFDPPESFVCRYSTNKSFATFSFFITFIIFVACKVFHFVLQRIRQPRLITEITAGLVMGNLEFMNELLDVAGPTLLLALSELGMSCYLLVLGLEMDPLALLARPSREAMVAYASVLSAFIVNRVLMPYVNLEYKDSSVLFFPLAISLSGTASPILTRLVTDLKMHKTDMGRLAVKAGMHSDMITLLLITLSSLFSEGNRVVRLNFENISVTLVIFGIQNFTLIKIVPIFVNWINEKNPEGKSIKGSHLVLFLAFMGFLYNLGPMVVGNSPVMTAFLVGLAFPRKGRLSKVLNAKINQFLREALSYAVHISKHPVINLTVIRFLQDNNADKPPSSKASSRRLLKAMQEQEMKLDDEFFAQFYEKNVAHGKVGYIEKHVSNAKETVATLRALEGQYVLFIVGRGSSVHSITTSIMKDWEECPDLGPTGEILADKDFSVTASVLVIQQHCIDENEK